MARNTYLTLQAPETARRLWFEAIDALGGCAPGEEAVPCPCPAGRGR